jgi:diacylglycerol kinase (ATP)
MSITKRLKSFHYAFKGIADVLRTQSNMRIHLLAAILAIALGITLKINAIEWIVVVVCIGMVMAMEAMNTAVEYLTDLVSPEHHPLAGKAKDAAAAAVLLAAMAALVVGWVVFGPKLVVWMGNLSF